MSAELLSVENLSAYLGVTINTVYGLTRKRSESGLPCIKIGKKTFFRKPSVDAWLASREKIQ